MASALHDRLRTATREAHAQIETCPPLKRLLADNLTRNEYLETLKLYYGFFAPLEFALADQADWRQMVPAFDQRLRAPKVRQDLLLMGMRDEEIDSLPTCKIHPQPQSLGKFMGISYVLEGSSLGGQMMARHLSKFDFFPQESSFFSIAPRETATNWTEFLKVLQSADSGESFRDDAVQGANETFSAMDQWLRTSGAQMSDTNSL